MGLARHGPPALKLALLVLPLGLDTFAVSAALGLRRLPRRERLRASAVMTAFETAMPLVGLGLGSAIGHVAGGPADYVAVAVLVAAGAWMLFGDEDAPAPEGALLLALGVSVSLDELAIGFTIGLLGLNVWLAVALIGAQALLLSQLGLRVGARLGEALRERAEQLAGVVLVALAVVLLVERL